jgi:thiamine-monophosphate kinase
VVVTGTIGDAALGLALRSDAQTRRVWKLDGRSAEHLVARYLVPEPRNALAAAIRGYASGAMDVSDGLVGDLTKLCRASGVAAELDAQRVPLSRAARAALAADSGLIETILTGGDDYEVVATVPPKKLAAFRTAARAAGVPVTPIGRIAAGQGVRVHGPDGKPLAFARGSFSHF